MKAKSKTQSKTQSKPRHQQKENQAMVAEDRATPAADLDRIRRKLNDGFQIWMICPEKSCRRAHACRGDAQDCFSRWWPHVPEDYKVLLRAFVKARGRGLSAQQALQAADAEVENMRV